jgi:tight adherence protein C
MLDLETVVPIGIFLAITMGVWGLLTLVSGQTSAGEERLQKFIERAAAKRASGLTGRDQQKIQEKMAQAASKFAKPLQPKDTEELGKLRVMMLNAGFRNPQAVQVFLGARFVGLLVGLAVGIPAIVSHFGWTQKGMMFIGGAAALGFYLPNLIVSSQTKKRQQAIFLGLPDALDLMVVCVEAGLGFDAAMRRVTSELALACPILCDELNITNFQMQMGRPRREALRELGVRTGVEDVRSLAAVIIQAEKFGSSIGAALRVQSESMRVRRRQFAEEKAAKTAVKIMLPLILFIFPGVFVVLVGPAAMKIAETMIK